MQTQDLKSLLDRKTEEYNRPDFIENDPVCIPHSFNARQDIEIAGFCGPAGLGTAENHYQ